MAYLTGRKLQEYLDYKQGVAPTTFQAQEPQRGFLENLAMGITKPFRTVAEDVTETGSILLDPRRWAGQGRGVERELQARGGYDPTFLDTQEYETHRTGDPLLEAAKAGAGVGAWAVPGTGALGGGLKGTLASGAVGGALGGFGASEGDWGEAGLEALKGGAVGGVTAGALYGLGKGTQWAGKKLKESELLKKGSKVLKGVERDRYRNTLKRGIGPKPLRGEGGAPLLDDIIDESTKRGFVVNNPEDLYELSDNLMYEQGGVVKEAIGDAVQKGVEYNPDIIMARIDKLVDSPKIPAAMKGQYQKAREMIADDLYEIVGSRHPSLSLLYVKKQGWGTLGKWGKITDPNLQGSTDVYEEAYKAASKQLSEAVGSNKYRTANAAVEKSLHMKQYADRAGLMNIPKGSWNDPLQDAMGFGVATAGGPGGIAAYGGSKFAQSKGFERLLGKGAGKVAEGLEKISTVSAPAKLQNILGSKTMQQLGQFGQKAAPIIGAQSVVGGYGDSFQGGTESDIFKRDGFDSRGGGDFGSRGGFGGGDAGNFQQILAMGVLGGQIDPQQATVAMKLLGLGEDKGVTKKQQETQGLTQQLDYIQELYGAGTGQSLALGKQKSVAPIELLKKGGREVQKALSPEYTERLNRYNNMREVMVGIINKARGAGVLNEGERTQMIEKMPNEFSSDREAQSWFGDIKNMLAYRPTYQQQEVSNYNY